MYLQIHEQNIVWIPEISQIRKLQDRQWRETNFKGCMHLCVSVEWIWNCSVKWITCANRHHISFTMSCHMRCAPHLSKACWYMLKVILNYLNPIKSCLPIFPFPLPGFHLSDWLHCLAIRSLSIPSIQTILTIFIQSSFPKFQVLFKTWFSWFNTFSNPEDSRHFSLPFMMSCF